MNIVMLPAIARI